MLNHTTGRAPERDCHRFRAIGPDSSPGIRMAICNQESKAVHAHILGHPLQADSSRFLIGLHHHLTTCLTLSMTHNSVWESGQQAQLSACSDLQS